MKYAVLIPAYNANNSLGLLLERTLRVVTPDQIVVVDDGSTDGTSTTAVRYSVPLVRHERNRGKGAALQTGFNYCLTHPFDGVITMDADLQHKPEDIPRFIDLFRLCAFDLIIGSRLHDKKGMPFLRKLSNTITTFLVGARTGAAIADSQSGYRFITRRVLEQVTMESTGFEAETEFLIKAMRKGFRCGAIPIDTVYAGEKSHMTHVLTTMNFIKVLLRQY